MRRLMKALTIMLTAAIGFSLVLINLAGAEEYIAGENLTIAVTNATIGTAITDAVCNITVSNSSGLQIDGLPMLKGADGTYFWVITTIEEVLTEKYLAKSNCSVAGNEWTTWMHFDIVDEYSYDKIDDMPADVWTSTVRTLTDYNQTDLLVNITQNAFDTIQSHVWLATTRTLSSYGTLIADIWAYAERTLTNWAEIPEMVWNATPHRNLTYTNSTGDTITYDNSTLNIILPADAI